MGRDRSSYVQTLTLLISSKMIDTLYVEHNCVSRSKDFYSSLGNKHTFILDCDKYGLYCSHGYEVCTVNSIYTVLVNICLQ